MTKMLLPEVMTKGCIIAITAKRGGVEISPAKILGPEQHLPSSQDGGILCLRNGLLQMWSSPEIRRFIIELGTGYHLKVDAVHAGDQK